MIADPLADLAWIPIDDAAKDGHRQLVKNGGNYAAAQWTGRFWSYPFGPDKFEGDAPEQIDFEPTHYLSKDSTAAPNKA